MTPDQITQIVFEVGALISGLSYNRHSRKKDMGKQANAIRAERERLEEQRRQFESEQVKKLMDDSAVTRKEMSDLRARLESNERKEEQLRSEMHTLTGRVDASNDLYREILEIAKLKKQKSETTVEPAVKPDAVDQTKITLKKESKS